MTLVCPGCGDAAAAFCLRIESQPVVLNYRFTSPDAARAVPRADLELAQCGHCGLVFNAAFDQSLIPYDVNYENTQSHSPAFVRHLENVARMVIERYSLRDASILEVGCGSGAFLDIICRLGENSGDGYDTACPATAVQRGGRLRFFARYLRAAGVTRRYDAVICRHVIEHVAAPTAFLRELHGIAVAAGARVVLLETPALEWICEHGSFWDLFYEHCNYFPMPTLARLCAHAGFTILDHRLEFGGQYQVLELRAAAAPEVVAGRAGRDPGARLGPDMEARRSALQQRLTAAGGERGWAIWGAGAKGVTLANRLSTPAPTCVIDSNPAKQGCFVPGAATPILAPDTPLIKDLAVILIPNPGYAEEISRSLRGQGFSNRIEVL